VLGITHLRIYATTKLLKSHEWIAVRSGKHKAMPNRMMKQMALHYKTGLLSIKPNRRFAKGAIQRFAFRLQWMLENKCAGDAMLLAKVINFAFASPTLRGAYQLRCIIRRKMRLF
jgi:hypothetical protein